MSSPVLIGYETPTQGGPEVSAAVSQRSVAHPYENVYVSVPSLPQCVAFGSVSPWVSTVKEAMNEGDTATAAEVRRVGLG